MSSQARCPLNKIFRIISLNSKAFCIFFCLFSMKFLRDFHFFSGGINTCWQVIARLLYNSDLQSVYLSSDELGVCTSTLRLLQIWGAQNEKDQQWHYSNYLKSCIHFGWKKYKYDLAAVAISVCAQVSTSLHSQVRKKLLTQWLNLKK